MHTCAQAGAHDNEDSKSSGRYLIEILNLTRQRIKTGGAHEKNCNPHKFPRI